MQTVQVGDIRMDVLFSAHPKRDGNHGLNLLEKQLRAAKESIDMALFVFSAQQLTNMLREKIGQGVERLVADPGFGSRPGSEVLICWRSPFQITPARWRLAISHWNNNFKISPPPLPVATRCTTSSP